MFLLVLLFQVLGWLLCGFWYLIKFCRWVGQTLGLLPPRNSVY